MSIMWAGKERGVKNMSGRRHADIVDAIEFGDANLVAKLIRSHMDSAADILVVSWPPRDAPLAGSTLREGQRRGNWQSLTTP